MKERVLILTGNYGDGHQQAANAIKESLLRNNPAVQADVVDYMKLTHPYAHPVCRYTFLQGVQKVPSLYGFLFQRTRDRNGLSNALKKMNRFGIGRLLAFIKEKRPSVVISTFPLAAGAMSLLKESGKTNVPAITVITDHTVHSSWVNPYTDHYLVGSDYVKQGLLKNDVPNHRCTVTGIPIRADFTRTYDRQLTALKHNLNPSLQTLMILGGGCGMVDDGEAMLQNLDALPFRIQVVIVCGRNERLKRKLQAQAVKSVHSIRVLGYVNEIHELMAVSDLIVTKPGGLTTSEALAMNLPMIMYKAIPGQEEDNAQFLLQAGAAAEANHLHQLIERIGGLLQSPVRLQAMRKQALSVQRKHAADAAASVIMKARREYNSAPNGIEALLPSLQM